MLAPMMLSSPKNNLVNLPNREEFELLTVVAFPNDSKTGFDFRTT